MITINGKKYIIKENGLLDKAIKMDHKLSNSTWGVVAMGIFGLIIGGVFAVGMNEIHPLF